MTSKPASRSVRATIFADGHDVLKAVVRWKAPGGRRWNEAPLTHVDAHIDGDTWTGSFAVDRSHDAAEVARLDRVLRHLEGHARYLGVPLRKLPATSYHPDGDELFDEANLGLQGVGELLTGVGPVFEHAR